MAGSMTYTIVPQDDGSYVTRRRRRDSGGGNGCLRTISITLAVMVIITVVLTAIVVPLVLRKQHHYLLGNNTLLLLGGAGNDSVIPATHSPGVGTAASVEPPHHSYSTSMVKPLVTSSMIQSGSHEEVKPRTTIATDQVVKLDKNKPSTARPGKSHPIVVTESHIVSKGSSFTTDNGLDELLQEIYPSAINHNASEPNADDLYKGWALIGRLALQDRTTLIVLITLVVVAATGVVATLVWLVHRRLTFRAKHRDNLTTMITDLQSRDKIVLLNSDESDED